MGKYAIAIHGGADSLKRSAISDEKELELKAGLQTAILAGSRILDQGGPALDAVQAAVLELENNPLFNAGRGAVFNNKGKHELDAAIMCGKTLEAGAIASVSNVKNPILLARAVMDRSKFVFLNGEGAEEFAKMIDLEFVSDDYYFTQRRYDDLQKAQENENKLASKHYGTVGAVALDIHGDLAAATSTGGLTNKKYGRIGDSPLIGCGTYANNESCAVSCTGDGEYFIRLVAAYEVYCLMKHKGMLLKEASEEVIINKLTALGGEGGLIAVDRLGNISLPHNTEVMYRAMKKSNESLFIEI